MDRGLPRQGPLPWTRNLNVRFADQLAFGEPFIGQDLILIIPGPSKR
jgi:hypothetical protein